MTASEWGWLLARRRRASFAVPCPRANHPRLPCRTTQPPPALPQRALQEPGLRQHGLQPVQAEPAAALPDKFCGQVPGALRCG